MIGKDEKVTNYPYKKPHGTNPKKLINYINSA